MPPWSASTPPDLPLRAATGITGTRCALAMRNTSRISSADSDEHRHVGRVRAEVRLVAAVRLEPLRVAREPLGGEGAGELGDRGFGRRGHP